MIVDGGVPTVTVVEAGGNVHPSTLTVYVPAFVSSAFGIVGFCSLDLKSFGPVHENVAFGSGEVAKSEIVEPGQYGPPFDAVGAQS